MRRATRSATAPRSADAMIKAREIHERRIRCADPALIQFPDDREADVYLAGVVAHVRRYRSQVPMAVLIEDDLAVLLINNYLRRRADQHDLAAMTRLRRCKVAWWRIAEPLQVTPQGAEVAYQRLRNAERPGGGRRSEVDARRDPRVDAQDRTRLDLTPTAYTPATVPGEIYDLARDLVAARRLVPEGLADEADNVRYARTPDATLSAVRVLLEALRAHPGPLAPPLQAVVDRGSVLVTR